MSEILLFGGSGKLGTAIKEAVSGTNLITPAHNECDITDPAQVKKFMADIHPQVVINAAAIVGTRECEENKRLAWQTNVNGALYIARYCQEARARCVLISSAAIFDGLKGQYTEEDPPTPTFYYAVTKVAAEQVVQMVSDHAVVRLDFFPRDRLKYPQVFDDHFTSKISVDEAAKKILKIAQSCYQGVINIGQERRSLFAILQSHFPYIEPIKIADSPLPNFPRDISLDLSKWKQNFE